jgi:predicted ester cyclase
LNTLFSAFPDLRFEVEQLLTSGDHVIGRFRMTGTHKGNFAGVAPTHKSVSWQACNVVELRNRKAIRSRVYADNVSLLRQLGVLAQPKATGAAG